MDNLSRHKRAAVNDRIEAAGATLRLLRAYSPDFDPIDKALSRLKAMVGKAGERTVSGLWGLIGRLIASSPPRMCELLQFVPMWDRMSGSRSNG